MPPVAFLNYGLIGLCGLIIWLFWRLFDREQRRTGTPRKQIIQFSWIFIVLSVMLVGTGLTLELFRIANDRTKADQYEGKITALQTELTTAKIKATGLKERVAARDELIKRLDGALGLLAADIRLLPSSKDTQATVSVDVPGHVSPVHRTVSVSVPLPENERMLSRLPELEALQKAVRESR